MITLFFIAAMAAIQLARGYSPTDPPHHINPAKWRVIVHWLTKDWACGLYVVLILLPFVAWWQAVGVGVLYFCAEFWFLKRVLFATWNGDASEYDKPAKFYKRPIHIMAMPFRALPVKLFAAIYGSIAGLAWAAMLLPLFSFSHSFIASASLCLTFGVVYYAMNLLPDSDEQGETVGRTIYGAILGYALAGVL